MALDVTIYPVGTDLKDPEEGEAFHVEYLSLVNGETYGKPPLITKDGNQERPTAEVGDRVLFVNPANVVAIEVEPV